MNRLYGLPGLAGKMARFGVVGLANTVIDLLVFATMLHVGAAPLLANVLAWLVAVSFSFFANAWWSFDGNPNISGRAAFFRFVSLGALISLGVSNATIALFAGWIGVWPAKIGGVAVAAALNFIAARWSIEGRILR